MRPALRCRPCASSRPSIHLLIESRVLRCLARRRLRPVIRPRYPGRPQLQSLSRGRLSGLLSSALRQENLVHSLSRWINSAVFFLPLYLARNSRSAEKAAIWLGSTIGRGISDCHGKILQMSDLLCAGWLGDFRSSIGAGCCEVKRSGLWLRARKRPVSVTPWQSRSRPTSDITWTPIGLAMEHKP